MKCPKCGMRQKMKIAFIYAILTLMIFAMLTSCGNTSGFLTKKEWAGLTNYMFAVEKEDFDGDVFESGDYRFYVRGTAAEPEDTVIVWDIYVSKNCYTNQSELNEYEYVSSVGGNSNVEDTIYLSKGDYVYLNYNEALGDPRGILCIEKQDTNDNDRKEIGNPQIDISQLVINYDVSKDELLEWDCIKATYTNNTKYTITFLSLTMLSNDGEEITVASVDEVRQGETSPEFNTHIEKALSKSDIKITECAVKITDESGAELYVSYDYETDKYKFY